MKKLLALSLTIFICLSCKESKETSNLVLHRKIPYPESDLISKFEWTAAPSRYPGTASDMHWWTWGIDDAIYIVDDDGENFGGPSYFAHVLKISGIPPQHKVETVTDFQDVPFRKMLPKSLLRRYVNGIIAIDSNIYVSVYDYDWNLERNKPYFDTLYERIQRYNCWHVSKDSVLMNNMYFTDNLSKNKGTAGIIQSKDMGKTWTNIPNAQTPEFLGSKFAGLAFLSFGPGYSNTPEKYKDYVFAYSNDGSWETGDHVYLARVHKDSIIARSAWQFLRKIDDKNQAYWSREEDLVFPILTDSGHVGHPTISYNPALKRYILGIYSDVVPHKENATYSEWKTWDKASEMQLYEGETPWGPWKIFYNEMPFGGKNHSCYLPQIPTKWWSKDGLSGTVMFAGDYTGHNFEYYGLMTWPFKITLHK